MRMLLSYTHTHTQVTVNRNFSWVFRVTNIRIFMEDNDEPWANGNGVAMDYLSRRSNALLSAFNDPNEPNRIIAND